MANILSIIIPVYNEEKAIGETVSYFGNLLNQMPEAELVIINDGSTDKTGETLANLNDSRITVLTHDRNKGYGAAIKTGVRHTHNPYLCITDADASYPNERIPQLLATCMEQNVAMVIGNRVNKKKVIRPIRRFGKSLVRQLAQYLSEEAIPDLNSGLRIIRRDLFENSMRFLPNGFSLTTTITLAALSRNFPILYVPIDYRPRKGRSKIKPIRDTLNFIQLIIRTVMFFNPLKIFLPLSIVFIFTSLTVLVASALAGRVMDITSILLFVTGLNFLATGMLADLIDKRLPR